MLIVHPFIWRKFLQLKKKLFSDSINAKKVVMTFAATVLLDYLFKALFAAGFSSELGMSV